MPAQLGSRGGPVPVSRFLSGRHKACPYTTVAIGEIHGARAGAHPLQGIEMARSLELVVTRDHRLADNALNSTIPTASAARSDPSQARDGM